MEETRIYYVDSRGNRWTKSTYTREEAEAASRTLVGCTNCTDCRHCHYCYDCHRCTDCDYCRYCHGCDSCHRCNYCDYCTNCNDCTDCRNCHRCDSCHRCNYCHGCLNCRRCTSCTDCTDCEDITGFDSNPSRLTSGFIGRRQSQTTYYVTPDREQIACGCFNGTLAEFEARVREVHKGTHFEGEYLAFIGKAKDFRP